MYKDNQGFIKKNQETRVISENLLPSYSLRVGDCLVEKCLVKVYMSSITGFIVIFKPKFHRLFLLQDVCAYTYYM